MTGILKRLRIRVELEPRDLWVGIYWDRYQLERHIFICLVPMVVIHVWWWTP